MPAGIYNTILSPFASRETKPPLSRFGTPMDPVDSGNSSAAATGKRPSLFAKSHPASNDTKPGEAISILSSLDKNAGKKSLRSSTGLPSWFTLAIGSLLGITIAAAIVMSLTRDSGLRPPPAQPVVIARAESPERTPEPPTAATPPNIVVSAGATIENTPPAAIAPTAATEGLPSAPPQATKPAELAPEAAVPAMAAPSAVQPVTQSAPPSVAAATPPPADKTVSVPQPETRAEKAVPDRKAKPARKDTKLAKKADSPADRDASLLAALVAYGEGKPAAEINANATAMKSQSGDAKPATGTPTLAQSGQFDPKRDVVLRSPNVSTIELVRRCRTLGFVEGLLCRNRVCANLWGKDPACPQAAAPSAGRGSE